MVLLAPVRRFAPVRRLATAALDAVLPPRCLACGALTSQAGALCSDCWPKLSFLEPPLCACCGQPFPYDMGAAAVCAGCAAAPPAYDRARAVFRYDEGCRGLLLAFKHADRTDAAPTFARWLARAGGTLLAEADLVVPVPLHWRRLFRRRYNQSALLANAVGRLAGKPVVPDLLLRRRNTPSQGHLSARQRHSNLTGAFTVALRRRALLTGRRVLLVDDVLTSGATVEACAGVLKRTGAASVDVLTLARVVLGST